MGRYFNRPQAYGEPARPKGRERLRFEIATLGRKGLNPHSPEQQYQVRSLPGQFCGLQLLCIMYVAFKMISPDHDLGFDLSKEYKAAKAIFEQSKRDQQN